MQSSLKTFEMHTKLTVLRNQN